MNTVKVVTDLKGLAEEVTNLDKKVEAMYAADIFGRKWDRNLMVDGLAHGLAIGLCVALTRKVVRLALKQKNLEDRVERLEKLNNEEETSEE